MSFADMLAGPSPEVLAEARELVACECVFRWLSGMLIMDPANPGPMGASLLQVGMLCGPRVPDIPDAGELLAPTLEGKLPDLRDPLTQLAVLVLVREAYPLHYVKLYHEGSVRLSRKSGSGESFGFDSCVEALKAASIAAKVVARAEALWRTKTGGDS